MIVISYLLTVLAYALVRWPLGLTYYLWMLFIFTLIFVLIMFSLRMYNVTTFCYVDRIVSRVAASSLASAATIAVITFLMQKKDTSRLFYLMFCLFCCVLVTVSRIMMQKIVQRRNSKFVTRVVFIGPQEVYQRYRHYMSKTTMSYYFVACLPFDGEQVKTPKCLEKYIIDNKIDEVDITYSVESMYAFDYKSYMQICEDMGITVRLVMDMFDMPTSQRFVNSIGTYPVITYHSVSMDKVQLFLKSVFDVLGASIGLIIASPIFLITAIAIKLESGGPVFFKQKRVGINGKVFDILKFRSMAVDAEERKQDLMAKNKIKDGMMFKVDNDPRVTKVGAFIRKTSIDELPQLINVLKREMSVVGPRPPTVDEVDKYERRHRRRISIRPGITGMWQVNGRSNVIDFESVVDMDSEYIDNWSLALDAKLLVQTVVVVLTRKGAY